MKDISPETKALIQRLYTPDGSGKKLNRSRDAESILIEIGNSGEPAAIIDIIPFILDKSPDVAKAAARSVHKLLAATTIREIVWLDQFQRRGWPCSGDYRYEWHKLSPDRLKVFERFGYASVSLFEFATFHRQGYVREAAVNRLAQITDGSELPFLLLRLNDWVTNVRDAAYAAIRSRLTPNYAPRFIGNLALVSGLEQATRSDHKQLVQTIYQLLQTAECRAMLIESLRSEDRWIKRASFKLAWNSNEPDLPEILRMALDEKDTVVRMWAAKRVGSAFTGAVLDYFREVMKRNKFMPIRREALRILARQDSPELLAELQTALLDTHASMRGEARYHLRQLNKIDLAAFYRDHLSAGEDLYSVISGLGETGARSDDHLIAPYTSHHSGKIRAAAIRALAKLNRNADVEIFITALEDEVPHVSYQALRVLAEKASVINADRIWELFRSAAHAHVKRNALSLIARLSKWDSIPYLVQAVRDPDNNIRVMSKTAIQRWLKHFNKSFSSPTSEQLANFDNALSQSHNLLDDQTAEELRFTIRSFN